MSMKTLLANKVTFTGTMGLELDISFGGYYSINYRGLNTLICVYNRFGVPAKQWSVYYLI